MAQDVDAGSGANANRPSVRGIGEQAHHVGQQTANAAVEVGRDAKARASSLLGEVEERVSDAVDLRKDDVAARIESTAKAIRRSGEELEGHSDYVAKLIESGADELAGLAKTLRTNDLQGLARHVQDFAKRQPALFAGAAIAVGFAAIRLGQVTAAGASQSDLPHAPEAPRAR